MEGAALSIFVGFSNNRRTSGLRTESLPEYEWKICCTEGPRSLLIKNRTTARQVNHVLLEACASMLIIQSVHFNSLAHDNYSSVNSCFKTPML